MLGYISKNKINLISISIGFLYVIFGLLKFFPNYSPAEEVAVETIDHMTFQLFSPRTELLMLAVWETGLGLLLILCIKKKLIYLMGILHMICTFVPLFIMSEQCFSNHFYSLSLLGQYIFKNIVILVAFLILFAEHVKMVTESSKVLRA